MNSTNAKPRRQPQRQPQPQVQQMLVNDYNDDDDKKALGGKINFGKAFKSVGKSLKGVGKTLKNDGKQALDATKKVVIGYAAKDAGKYIYDNMKSAGKNMLKGTEEIGTELEAASPEIEAGLEVGAEGAAEYAPLALMAAGMRKPKQKRVQSDRQKRRGLLIKKLMSAHGMTLPEASSYIRDQNIQY